MTKKSLLLFVVFIGCVTVGCSQPSAPAPEAIHDFDSCMKAGGMMLKTYPAQCVLGDEKYVAAMHHI